jgi:hypothetical protein
MSRITHAGTTEQGGLELHTRLVAGTNRLLGQLRSEIGAPVRCAVDIVAVGNTAMHHSLANLPLRNWARRRTCLR